MTSSAPYFGDMEGSAFGHNPFQEDDDEEEFVYRGHDSAPNEEAQDNDEEEEFVYSGLDKTTEEVLPPPQRSNPRPSPAQLESLNAAASSGDLPLLKKLFKNAVESGAVEPFNLANEASARTGFTALHAAASRGHLDVVTWLIEECGAMPDLEDKEGETAVHKASLNGHLKIVQYLLPSHADVHARDADGWTALHNCCSKGYLDIVRFLCEKGGASSEFLGVRGVDARSKGGWTPLMNAASKGHLPIVLYLLNKQGADPMIRNNWGETAFDIASAVFEIYICEVLQRFEAEKWQFSNTPYNPLSVHITVPLILYENQRLDNRLKTLAVSGGRPKFSAHGLGREGSRPPFELKLPKPDHQSGARLVPAWRSDVRLPLKDSPWELPIPRREQTPDTLERSHFWLSDWTLDVTDPGVNANDGWQYASRFSDSDDQWTAEMPPQLERMLAGSAMVRGLSGTASPGSATPQTWVRRRRWVRVMRRRLDIPQLPFLEPDGIMYCMDLEGNVVPYRQAGSDQSANEFRHDASSMDQVSSNQDYVGRARYLVGTHARDAVTSGHPTTGVETRRAIAKLERATTELKLGIRGDSDPERRTQAEVLLNAYNRELDRQRAAAGNLGLLISTEPYDSTSDDESSEEEFHYPGVSGVTSSRSSINDVGRRGTRVHSDIIPQLSQAPDFRVPMHDAPQKVISTRMTPTSQQLSIRWERDDAVAQCRDCQRKFTFLFRRHHCRRCGRIFCDRCSSFRALLDPSEVVHEPGVIEGSSSSATSHRVCQGCYDGATATLPDRLRGGGISNLERIIVDQQRLHIPNHISRRQSSSQLSDLAECPVCNQNLEDLGNDIDQEAHVRNCLEGGHGSAPQTAKYLVYTLPQESALVGTECVICLEEFSRGSTIARLSCLCSFHNHCLSSWLQRGKSCPVHAR